MLKKILATGDSDFKEVLVHSFFAFLVIGLAGIAQLVFNFVLGHKFGASGLGLYYLAYSFIFMLSLLGRLGFNRAVVKFIPGFVSQKEWGKLYGLKRTAERITWLLTLILTAAILLLAGFFAHSIFHEPEAAKYLRVLALCLPLMSLSYVQTGILSGLKLIRESVFLERAGVNLFAIFFVLIFAGWLGLDSAIIGTVIATYLTVLAANALIKKHVPRTGHIVPFDQKLLLGVALPLFFVDFSNQMTGQLNILVLGAKSSAGVVGVFSAALQVSAIIGIVLTGVNYITTTKIAELHSRAERSKLDLLASKTAALGLLISLPLVIIFMVAPGPILHIFGSSFNGGSLALRFLVIAQLINVGFGSVVQILSMTGYHKPLAYATVGTVFIMNVILSLILVPIYGLNGAAAAVAISLIAKNIILLIMIRRYLGIWSLPFRALGLWSKSLLRF
ncbi:MAG TPA: oligosaccharide flippase family protein [Candidatus Saccharimonadales bacterium]|nr:oligosaccharide flippase family protein [Candidatus Saccharimonadales bacterium]